MNLKPILLIWLTTCLLGLDVTLADDNTESVRLSLAEYNRLVDASRKPELKPRQPPAGYALGNAIVTVTAKTQDGMASADIEVRLTVEVFESDWLGIPILPPGTSVSSVTVGGSPAQLISSPKGLLWAVKKSGKYSVRLKYHVNGTKSAQGYGLAIPLPEAASISFKGTIPGKGLNPALIPSASLEINESGDNTRISASVPSGRGVQLSWQVPSEHGHTISRAYYRGKLQDDAVNWSAALNVELFGDQPLVIKLLPKGTTLNDIQLDGKNAPILIDEGSFATRISGKGLHKVQMNFQVPVIKDDGPPKVMLRIPKIPVSRFDLSIPGKKEVSVLPQTNVVRKQENDDTIATFYVPMTQTVTFSWNEMVPEELTEETRANSTIIHTLFAEEGVLYANAMMQFEVTRGKTSLVEFETPHSVQINRISSPTGAVADWRVTRNQKDGTDRVSVFLNREIEKTLTLQVQYDQSIVGKQAKENIEIPLIRAINVHRQRGMVALLSSKELTLKPSTEEKLIKVGENQLPAVVRQSIDKTIAHTYKYVEDSPELIVKAAKPERKQGKFDAMVNTLVSLSDVTIKGSASVEVNVKSGAIMEMQLVLPKDVNFLSLSAPSLRNHKVNITDDKQTVDLYFTQEMEGQFRVETAYEQILVDTEADIAIPTLGVNGAEVEQGKIAVEALSAVEVHASSTIQLSSLGPSELPQQLVLKTTNPILLAYRYVHTDPPYQLALRITRHQEIDTQAATIDKAVYRTLFTEDGLAVTSAEFIVRNSRKQFLRVNLPEGSSVWSAYVDGKAEKPALAERSKDENDSPNVLIKIINSSNGFPVNLIYQTPVSKIGKLGTIGSALPRPDMVVTETHWDVYLPDEISYGKADTNMRQTGGNRVSKRTIEAEVSQMAKASGNQVIAPLRLSVPAFGIRYSFEKLYANQSDEDAYFTIPYTSGVGIVSAYALLVLGTILVWFGCALAVFKKNISGGSGTAIGGVGLLAVMIGYFGMTWMLPAILSIVIAVLVLGYIVQQRLLWKKNTEMNPEKTDIIDPREIQ